MAKNKQKNQLENVEQDNQLGINEEKSSILKKKTIKELIAPSGIDASNLDYLKIISSTTRYARSFFIFSLPRMATFPYLLRDMYEFGDINNEQTRSERTFIYTCF